MYQALRKIGKYQRHLLIDLAAMMLKMLQDQAYSRQARKQALYRSWFR